MDDDEKNQAIRGIAGRFYDLGDAGFPGDASLPFDISKPNLHDTKSEFLAEFTYVEDLLNKLEQPLELLESGYRDEDGQHEVARNVARHVDAIAVRNFERRVVNYPSDLVTLSAAKTGLTLNVAFLIYGMLQGLLERKQELESQKTIYWSSKGRAPNHYARAIALRFAKLIARKTGQRPTFGTSRDGSHPSTDYGRALEDIFHALGISATVKHPAVWALKQISDEDLKPDMGGLLGSLLYPERSPPRQRNALTDIVEQLAKRRPQ